MTIADIQNLIKNGESRTLELKKTTGELQDGMHSACAMLNSDGGYLIFGVTPSLKITGQQITDNTKQEIANALTGFDRLLTLCPSILMYRSTKAISLLSSVLLLGNGEKNRICIMAVRTTSLKA